MTPDQTEKKQIVHFTFLKGMAAGYLMNLVFNKFAFAGALLGLGFGVAMEQRYSSDFPIVADVINEKLKYFKDIYNENTDDWSDNLHPISSQNLFVLFCVVVPQNVCFGNLYLNQRTENWRFYKNWYLLCL